MIICQHCFEMIREENSKFCPECGTPVIEKKKKITVEDFQEGDIYIGYAYTPKGSHREKEEYLGLKFDGDTLYINNNNSFTSLDFGDEEMWDGFMGVLSDEDDYSIVPFEVEDISDPDEFAEKVLDMIIEMVASAGIDPDDEDKPQDGVIRLKLWSNGEVVYEYSKKYDFESLLSPSFEFNKETLEEGIMLMKFTTVNIEDDEEELIFGDDYEDEVRAFAFKDGEILSFSIEDADEEIDENFDIDAHRVSSSLPIDVDDYDCMEDLVQVFLDFEGQAYVRDFYYSEELAIVNKEFTVEFYNKDRKKVFTYTGTPECYSN